MTREELARRYLAVRARTEHLAAPLSPEDQGLQSMPSASPTKWHRAHTTWFFEAFVLAPRGIPPVDPRYGYLFNSYYEGLGERHARPKRGLLSRPTAEAVGAYRRAVDASMCDLLREAPDEDWPALEALVDLGLAHEQQHQELLLTDIRHAFSESPLLPAYLPAGAPSTRRSPGELVFAEHAGGVCVVGHEGTGFSFDNEGPRHRIFLEPFAIATRPVNVAEVRAFVEAGGYRTPSLWLSAGYERVRALGLTAPHGMRVEPGSVLGFTLRGLVELDPAEPASHLDYYEADAIARFLGGRLPTEGEWEHVASHVDPEAGNFVDDEILRPVASASGSRRVEQLFGDVWEWTSSSYAAYPGYAPAEGAVGEYNGKFMVGQYVLRGGSALTPRGHVRATYRNFWPPDTGFQMTGARVARDVRGETGRPRERTGIE